MNPQQVLPDAEVAVARLIPSLLARVTDGSPGERHKAAVQKYLEQPAWRDRLRAEWLTEISKDSRAAVRPKLNEIAGTRALLKAVVLLAYPVAAGEDNVWRALFGEDRYPDSEVLESKLTWTQPTGLADFSLHRTIRAELPRGRNCCRNPP